MADEPLSKVTKIRKELEQHRVELQELAVVLDQATKEEDPEPLSVHQLKTLTEQLDDLKVKIKDAVTILSRNETDEAAMADDNKNRTKLLQEWERLKHCMMDISTMYKAERMSANLLRSIKRLEKLQAENPTRNYKEGIATLNPQMISFREALDVTNIAPEHPLWTTCEEFEEKIYSMLSYEPTPADAKDSRKVHDKSSYKVSALAVPKFNGKIQNWVSFWQEFNYAVHKKTDMEEAVKMVYLKQAITDPGLNTTISDLGIEEGSYAAAIKVLHDRYDKPRVMHRLFCESLRDLKSTTNNKTSLSDMADKAQHIWLGLLVLNH